MPRVLAAVFALLLTSSCQSGGEPTSPNGSQLVPSYRPVADVSQTMQWILDPAADVIWDSAGFVIAAEGKPTFSPRPTWAGSACGTARPSSPRRATC